MAQNTHSMFSSTDIRLKDPVYLGTELEKLKRQMADLLSAFSKEQKRADAAEKQLKNLTLDLADAQAKIKSLSSQTNQANEEQEQVQVQNHPKPLIQSGSSNQDSKIPNPYVAVPTNTQSCAKLKLNKVQIFNFSIFNFSIFQFSRKK